MRPASSKRRCFYCRVPVGGMHQPDCVLVCKNVTVHVTLKYEIQVPHAWDEDMVEFHRNESSWCKDNMLDELDRLEGCLCQHPVEFHCPDASGEAYLSEDR
jgi:hypothetical protein